jgi:type IV pilus assembly protein PilO
MKLTSMQKMLAVIALIAVVSVAVFALVILPKFGEIAQLDSDLQAAKDQVAQTQTLLNQLQQAKANAAVTQADLLRLSNEFPENPELPSLIIELQDVANSSGVRFNSVTPQEPSNTPGQAFTEVPIQVSLGGKWSDVLDYLRRINKMTRAVRVTDVALSPVAASTSPTVSVEPSLSAELSLRAYVMAVNGVPPAAATSKGAPSGVQP